MLLAVLLLAGAAAAAVLLLRSRDAGRDDRRAAAVRFVAAWERGDEHAMWRALTPTARAREPLRRFTAKYRRADDAAGVRTVRAARPQAERDGHVRVRVAVTTKDFGVLRGTIALPVDGSGEDAGVAWDAALRLPGLRPGEAVRRRSGARPTRGEILAADGTPLADTVLGTTITGTTGDRPTGLQRRYDDRLGGRPSSRLLFGLRVVRKVRQVPGRNVRTTIRPGLTAKAAAALGDKLGGVAVLDPEHGDVLALAGLAVSAPQPPGSTFKIITLAAALDRGIATPSSSFPVRTFATLSGTKLRNASGESCGGALPTAFAESCNSVFAPLGAKLGARRLQDYARAFGFGEQPRIPAAKPSTIAADLRDDLAVGAAAIGQDRDLATPLGMASVGATIAADGVRARPRIATLDPVQRRRAVPAKVAHQVRSMMVAVVASGTGTAARLPGVTVAGKTGTAELRPNSTDAKDADAWFVAFAPAKNPQVAVAVMLVGAGFGGTAAAPIARQVLGAALR